MQEEEGLSFKKNKKAPEPTFEKGGGESEGMAFSKNREKMPEYYGDEFKKKPKEFEESKYDYYKEKEQALATTNPKLSSTGQHFLLSFSGVLESGEVKLSPYYPDFFKCNGEEMLSISYEFNSGSNWEVIAVRGRKEGDLKTA